MQNDLEEWADVRKSFVSMQMSQEQTHSILSIVSGVMKLGNVIFEGKNIDGQDNAADIPPAGLETLKDACHLLFLDDYQKVADNLRTTVKMIGKDEVTVRVQQHEAVTLCQSLGKAMFDMLFKWIIQTLNKTIQPPEMTVFMGMLDIFGFEVFEANSLEQLLINITNEFLQKNFVDIVFDRVNLHLECSNLVLQESKLYREEGVSTTELVFTDNKDVIECLIGKRASVFASLEDACVAKGGTDQSFYSSMTRSLEANRSFKKPAGGDRDMKFLIVHTIAEIEYSAADFISKNMDLLKAELTEVAQASPNDVVREMFSGIVVERGKLAKGQLIASQFLRQLDQMIGIIMVRLDSLQSNFPCCRARSHISFAA